jgi:hypothetical protein
MKITIFFDVMQYGLYNVTSVSKESAASIFRAEEYPGDAGSKFL